MKNCWGQFAAQFPSLLCRATHGEKLDDPSCFAFVIRRCPTASFRRFRAAGAMSKWPEIPMWSDGCQHASSASGSVNLPWLDRVENLNKLTSGYFLPKWV